MKPDWSPSPFYPKKEKGDNLEGKEEDTSGPTETPDVLYNMTFSH